MSFKYCITFLLLQTAFLFLNAQSYHKTKSLDTYVLTETTSLSWFNEPLVALNYAMNIPSPVKTTTMRAGFILPMNAYKSSIGGYFVRDDQNGVFTQTQVQLKYSYKLKVNRMFTLEPGFQGGFKINAKNYGNLTFQDGTSFNNELLYIPQFGFGSSLIYNKNQFYSIGINQIFNDQGKLFDPSSITINLAYFANFKHQVGNHLSNIQPMFVFSYNQVNPTLFYGIRGMYRNIFGGFYVNQNMFFNMNSVTVLLGTYIGPYHIYYTYDINLYKNLSFLNGFNSNEVTFLMKIRYKNDKRKRKAIKCPDL